MAMDTPAVVAILGAGPVGIEAGLYARYLGYDVVIFEREQVGAHVLNWGHLQMFSPFQQLRTPLGLSALRAQHPDYQPPPDDALLTGQQWVEDYLAPLAETDLLADHIICGADVQGVARCRCLKLHRESFQQREEDEFRILINHSDGSQSIEVADIVVDTTGVYGQPNWCGAGGIPARGEQRLRSRIEYQVPDVLGSARADYEARSVLVIGSGMSAATTVVSLARLVEEVPQTFVTWITHRVDGDPTSGPIVVTETDRHLQRHLLADEANRCAHAANSRLVHRAGITIDAFDFDAAEEKFLVTFSDQEGPESFDRIVANVGYRGDATLFEELQVQMHVRTGGPQGVGDWLLSTRQHDARLPTGQPATRILTTEPNFYILGAKSFGRDSSFLMPDGCDQIRDLFSIIGDRQNLDLYATMN